MGNQLFTIVKVKRGLTRFSSSPFPDVFTTKLKANKRVRMKLTFVGEILCIHYGYSGEGLDDAPTDQRLADVIALARANRVLRRMPTLECAINTP